MAKANIHLKLPFRRTAATYPMCANEMPVNRGAPSQTIHDDGGVKPNTIAQSGGRSGFTVKATPWSNPETWAQSEPQGPVDW
jgi:hypothetical protein